MTHVEQAKLLFGTCIQWLLCSHVSVCYKTRCHIHIIISERSSQYNCRPLLHRVGNSLGAPAYSAASVLAAASREASLTVIAGVTAASDGLGLSPSSPLALDAASGFERAAAVVDGGGPEEPFAAIGPRFIAAAPAAAGRDTLTLVRAPPPVLDVEPADVDRPLLGAVDDCWLPLDPPADAAPLASLVDVVLAAARAALAPSLAFVSASSSASIASTTRTSSIMKCAPPCAASHSMTWARSRFVTMGSSFFTRRSNFSSRRRLQWYAGAVRGHTSA